MEVQGSDASFKFTSLVSSLHRYYSYSRKEAAQLGLCKVMLLCSQRGELAEFLLGSLSDPLCKCFHACVWPPQKCNLCLTYLILLTFPDGKDHPAFSYSQFIIFPRIEMWVSGLVVQHSTEWLGNYPGILRHEDLRSRYLGEAGYRLQLSYLRVKALLSSACSCSPFSVCAFWTNGGEAMFCFRTWCFFGENWIFERVFLN